MGGSWVLRFVLARGAFRALREELFMELAAEAVDNAVEVSIGSWSSRLSSFRWLRPDHTP